MIQAKVLNTLLLPGTLVAQIGHVLGLLVTGATISNTTLYKDASGEPEITRNPQPRIPVIGPVVIGLLPLVACATAIYYLAEWLGGWVLIRLPSTPVGPAIPTSLHGIFDLLRELLILVESLVNAIRGADLRDWRSWLFLYLLTCLTVRTAPFPGTLRGSLGAIVLLGVGGAMISSMFDVADPRVQNAWSALNLAIAVLLLLLFASLMVRGIVGLIRTLAQGV